MLLEITAQRMMLIKIDNWWKNISSEECNTVSAAAQEEKYKLLILNSSTWKKGTKGIIES